MTGRTIAIGDIHGCLKALDALLQAIQPTKEDTIITLGDYVDRGPNSKGVIDRLIELGKQTRLVTLMGNHEEMMLSVVKDREEPYRWLQYGGVDTLDSYGFGGDLSVVPQSHLDFLTNLDEFFETDTHIFVHANYNPLLPLRDQSTELLRWVKLSEYLPEPHMSGKRVVLGHTHDRGGEVFWLDHLICLDTYCYGGGWLTAFDVDSEDMWQADNKGQLRE
jgi:serine/threonine protein phosphatase 1